MDTDFIPLSMDDEFQFACSPEVPCFNQCCRDINQYLTPYDIFRLKNRLKKKSGDFLKKFTVEHIGPQTGLPIVSLKALPQEDLRCPFVAEEGCQVYEDRPASCRTYPLARAVFVNLTAFLGHEGAAQVLLGQRFEADDRQTRLGADVLYGEGVEKTARGHSQTVF